MRKVIYFRMMVILCMSAMSFIACGDDDEDTCKGTGFTRCLNAFPPDEIRVSGNGEIQTLEWKPMDTGPRCIGGDEYRSFIKKGTPNTEDITIYMPHDGAWLVESNSTLFKKGRAPLTYEGDITRTNFTPSRHDAIKDSNFLYVSPCDGSLYIGDIDYTTEELEELGAETAANKRPRYYRGFLNTTASINELARQNPNPKRVFLLGTLAGGYGVIGAAIHTAELFPDADIFILQDGSPGMGMGDVQPEFIYNMIDAWGARQTLTDDIDEYIATGHLVPVLNYILDTYDNIYAATFASVQEASIRLTIEQLLGSTVITPEIYECFVKSVLEDVRKKAPAGRYQYYVVDQSADNMHELREDTEDGSKRVGEDYVLEQHDGSPGISVEAWLDQFIHKSEDWKSYSEVEMGSDVACKDL